MFRSSKRRRSQSIRRRQVSSHYVANISKLISRKSADAGVVETPHDCEEVRRPLQPRPAAGETRARGVFISYRQRGDYRFMAASIHYAFKRYFGAERVFFDISSMRPGARYPDELRHALARSGVLIAVIHRDWVADLRERQGARSPDWVLFELETALRTGMVVVPVLLDDAQLPSPEELPEEISDLAHRHACVLRWWSFGDDLDRLVKSVELYLPGGP